MTCQELVELVTDYLDRALDAPTLARLEAHLADCPHCERYVAQIRLTIGALGTLESEPELTPEARQRAMAQFRALRRG